MLGRRAVMLSIPGGEEKILESPLDVKPGSRAVVQDQAVLVLENGSSRLLKVDLDAHSVEELTVGNEARRFRASLGSRLALVGGALLVTGTPGPGAHTPWLFDLASRTWVRLPDAPHPILSSAVVASEESVTIVGGWSKQRSCHGHAQTLSLRGAPRWAASDQSFVPWRRPGAGCQSTAHGMLVALGWMECVGEVGSGAFRLLRRNGAAQRAPTSSSRLCALDAAGAYLHQVAEMPLADSYEHNGEIYPMGNGVVCIGRDHVQAFDLASERWQTWRLPHALGQDNSSSWTKHCGSWALAWLPP